MSRFYVVFIWLAMGLPASFSALAGEAVGLYEAEVPVTSQDAAARAAASRAALEEVLVKVSGSADVLQRPEIKPLLGQAEQLVQRYQYRTAPPGSGTADISTTPTQILWTAFDRQTINHRLSEAALPVWGLNRPSTLLWLAVEEGGDRYLVGGDYRPDLQGMINTQARRRGLPLNLPLQDLQDQASVAVADVWGDFSDAIFKASDRYQPDAMLVGRVYAVAADKWQSHWTLYHRGGTTTWDSAQGLQNEAIAAGIAGAAEQFAKRYALTLTPDVASSVLLTIENVATLEDYAHALHYLQSLDPVAGVQIARVEGTAFSYRLKVRGQPQALIQTISWGKTLMTSEQGAAAAPVMPAAGDRGEENSGEYRYRIAP